ncbi:acetyltransf_18 domain-containing protein [Caerostris extrusa]|uniref:Acetyltransf_18 domain-containing protein n=1 Tax=Caerostris extrusa TaxID=172846 RepID=A0AAV4XEF1_CAEEX|nr:acetyltransf_18 domain-containing protein [Caerostris extrusa]
MFSVQEKSRAADVGRKLLSACHTHADGRNIGVNCEMDKIGTFKRRGVAIFEDTFKSLEYEIYSRANSTVLSEELPSGVEILPFQSQYLEAVYEYDHSLMGYERKSTVEASCYEDNSKTLIAIKDGKCVGFGSIKLNIMGIARVGPLYADDPVVAEAMLKRLINEMPEVSGFTTVTISSNLYANMMMEKLGLPVHGNIYRLYSKEKLKVDTNKVFAHFDIDFAPF